MPDTDDDADVYMLMPDTSLKNMVTGRHADYVYPGPVISMALEIREWRKLHGPLGPECLSVPTEEDIEVQRQRALAKLTPEERRLLGV